MKLLILGGTVYLGPHTVMAAQARGHQVTLFNRGLTNPELFPELEKLRGDREKDLSALAGRRWDAVIDPSGFLPRVVRASCAALAGEAEHYVFVSSISAYADKTKRGLVETDALAELPPGTPEELTGESYGALKVLCEREVESAWAGRSAIVRAGLIFGPHDPTDRSLYWPLRVARGGEVLAPGPPERPIQLVDVGDLANWLVRLAEERVSGTYNATGPARTLTMGEFLEACRAVARSDARLTWVSEEFLLEREVGPYSEMPLWVPERYHMFETVDCSRAQAAGLTYRPLADTLMAMLAWAFEGRSTRPSKPLVEIAPAMTPERETELLAAWHAGVRA